MWIIEREDGSKKAEGYHFLHVAYQLFPTWEYFVPNVGIIHSQRWNAKPAP